jgi:hypothetical protein
MGNYGYNLFWMLYGLLEETRAWLETRRGSLSMNWTLGILVWSSSVVISCFTHELKLIEVIRAEARNLFMVEFHEN